MSEPPAADLRERTLFLHLGLARCGTRAIAGFGEARRAELLDRGILYPSALDLGFGEQDARGPNGHGLAVAGDPDGAVARIAASLDASGADRFLVSSDQLLATRDGRLEQLVAALGARGIRTVAVFYVREQREWLIARWAQRRTTPGWTATLDDYLTRGMAQDSLDYGARCTDLARAAGRENVVVRRFMPGALTGGDIRVDLLALAGIDVTDLASADPMPAATATPLPAALYEEASPEILRATAEHFAPGNEALRREFLPSVPAPLFATAIRPDPRFDLPLRRYYELLQEQILHATHWMGVPMRKNPLDAWVCQEILHAVRPDVLVEIGSYVGGSTLFFAHLMDLLGHGEVVSVEVRRDRYRVEHPRITEVTGESLDPGVIAEVRRRCEGRRAMVVHDGDHSRETVLADLRAYAGLVPVGSYVVVEDGTVDQFPVGSALHPRKFAEGPLLAVEDFLRADDRFQIDRGMERYVVTWNPSGYLRRVR